MLAGPAVGSGVRRAFRSRDSSLRRTRGNALTALVGVVSVITYALHGFDGALSRDLAIYSYAGQQVANGVPPYEGILNRAGPLAHALPAIGVAIGRLGGFDDVLGMRIVFLVFAAACVCMVFELGRGVFGSDAAGLACAAAFLTFHGFITYASDGPREKTPMVLFIVWSLWAIHRRRWVVAGFALSLATLTLQIAFPVGAAAAFVGLLAVRRGNWLRALAGFVTGGLIPVAICVVYFAAVGNLSQAVESFYTINAHYTFAAPFTQRLSFHWSRLQIGYGISVWLILVGLAALLILSGAAAVGLIAARRRGGRHADHRAVSLLAMAAGAVAGLAWILHDFNDWPDAMTMLPFAALGFGALVAALQPRMTARALRSACAVWIVACLCVALTYSVGARDHRLTVQRRSVAAKLAALPSGASLLAINSPQPLVLSHRTNPIRIQTFSNGLAGYVDDTWPGGLAGFVAWIDRQRPTVITVGGTTPAWLHGTLADYERVGAAPGWVWYVNRSVGQHTLSAVLHAR